MEQIQPTWVRVSHSVDPLVTWETQAKRHAGGVAITSLDSKAKETTEDKTVWKRIFFLVYIIM